jgi:hypothetical protein
VKKRIEKLMSGRQDPQYQKREEIFEEEKVVDR